jgi:hypothetical protein
MLFSPKNGYSRKLNTHFISIRHQLKKLIRGLVKNLCPLFCQILDILTAIPTMQEKKNVPTYPTSKVLTFNLIGTPGGSENTLTGVSEITHPAASIRMNNGILHYITP